MSYAGGFVSSSAHRTCIAVLGGSSAYLPALAHDLLDRCGELPPLEIRLFGRNASRVEGVAGYCNRRADERQVDHRYRSTTQLGSALRGVDVIVNMMRIGGFAGRSHDERFPLPHGYPGDETIGPSGLASAIRSLPVVMDAARTAEDLAPQATWIQMGNPLGVLLTGLTRETRLRAFGLCELPQHTLTQALDLVGAQGEVQVDYVGLNHQGFFTRIEQAGQDLLPRIRDRIDQLEGHGFFRVSPRVIEDHAALPLHYLRLYFDREQEVARQSARDRDRGQELEAQTAQLHAAYATRKDDLVPALLARRSTVWNALTLVPALIALCGGPLVELYISEPNHGHLPFLPDDAIVEKRAILDSTGIRADAPGLPEDSEAWRRTKDLLVRIQRFEERSFQAAAQPCSATVLAALTQHPFGIPIGKARSMLPQILPSENKETRPWAASTH